MGMIYFWLLIILALYTFKPVGFFNRLMVMAGTYLLGFLILYTGFALIFDFNPIPFSGALFSSRIFVIALILGVLIIWISIVEEQLLIAEKAYAEEKTGRILSEKRLVENRLNLLQAQIEPRFLFNTMKSISDLFDTAPEKAKAMQMHFIQYIRATLVKTRERITTVEQEMELIRSYLDIFKVGMGERLEYYLDIDPQTKDLTFPSMLVQPVVENAIKHGLEKIPGGGRISISVKKREDMIRIIIADTGNGLNKEDRMAIILSDVRERIGSLFGDKGQLRFEENNPSGLIVIIEVPYG
jgi:sensor histidine kinase YesM